MTEDEVYAMVNQVMRRYDEAGGDADALTEPERNTLLVWLLDEQVSNGGFSSG